MALEQSEYNALKAMYHSEGYGIFIRLIDEQINVNLGKLLGGSDLSESQLSGIIYKMRGMGKARSLVDNTLKEEGHKHEDKTIK